MSYEVTEKTKTPTETLQSVATARTVKTLVVYRLHDENQKALQNAVSFKILKELANSKADYNDEMNV